MAETGGHHVAARLQALFVTLLWSTSWVLIKLGLEEIPAVGFAGMRYTLAFLLLAPALAASTVLRRELRRLRASDWLRLAILGVVFYSLAQGAQFMALSFLPAVTLSLILSFTPAAVALLGAPLLGERLGIRHWAGLACFLLGAALYFLPLEAPLQPVGLAVAAVCLLANSGASILGRAVNRRGDLHPLLVTVVSMGVGSLLLLAVGFAVEGVPRLDLSGWAIVLWLAVVNTALAFTIWNHTLRRLTALESTLINNTMLVQIAVLAWLFLGESIGLREGIGLILAECFHDVEDVFGFVVFHGGFPVSECFEGYCGDSWVLEFVGDSLSLLEESSR
jgi:drug/metabolite transporter (DMT)-like permease